MCSSDLDAEIMDPQQRFLLECAVETLDMAGYPNEKHAGRIGVFVGKGTSLYLLEHLLPDAEIVRQLGLMPILNVNEKDYAATLVSYKLNLTGPSLNVNTACSTSLVAVHLACQSLLNRECEIALAGGVSFVSLRKSGYIYQEGHILSPDGLCRAFSGDANGTVFGSGVGLVALKPLASALRDRDTIHAVIKGSAINNDGCLKVSFSAPSLSRQADVIAEAQAKAAVTPDTIQYVEAHGTGTDLGDVIEFGALRRVFGGPRPDGTRCALGSVKTNIGHLDSAAGVASLIKVVQALKHNRIPPILHVGAKPSRLDFAESPFTLSSTLKSWEPGDAARRAGVSSFGVGGTNAHIILEEAPLSDKRTLGIGPQILPISAKSPESLNRMTLALSDELSRRPDVPLEDVALTLQVGRNSYPYRSYIVCDHASEARKRLADPAQVIAEYPNKAVNPEIVFLFPGQGSLRKNATRELYRNEPRFRSLLDEYLDLVQQYTGDDLRQELFAERQDDMSAEPDNSYIEQTAVAQPLLFSIEYALARFWESLGVHPTAMLGHSLGEYVAACIAGVFSLPEALSLVIVRSRLMQSLPAGQMVAVSCSEREIRAFLDDATSLAVVNTPWQCVASGPTFVVEALQDRLDAAGIANRLLRTSHAFHSQMMDPILQTFEDCVAEVERRAPAIPFVSNLTGKWITDAEATSPAYWARHLREAVRFAEGLQAVLGVNNHVLLEVGPGRTLTNLVKQTNPATPAIASLNGEHGSSHEHRSFLDAVGQLWQRGVDIDWMPLHEGREPSRVPLPAYTFDRKRHWIERRLRLGSAQPAAPAVEAPPESQYGNPVLGLNGNGHGFEIRAELIGPQHDIEIRVLEIWRSFLGTQNIGVRQSFFEMGGDSLLATRLHSQIRREFQVELPLAMMFELETIRKLSLYIAVTRDMNLIDTLSEEDLDDVLAVMESWATRPAR